LLDLGEDVMDATASNSSAQPTPVVPAGPGVAGWMQRYRWMILLRSFRLALDARQMIVASAAVLAMLVGWWGLAKVFSGASDPQVQQMAAAYSTLPWQAHTVGPVATTGSTYVRQVPMTTMTADGQATVTTQTEVVPISAPPRQAQPFATQASINAYFGPYTRLTAPFAKLFNAGLTISGFTFSLLAGLWGVAVWGYAGGVITRMAGVRLTRDERATLGPAMRHARSRWGSYFWAPLMPLVGLLVLALPIFALGWLLRFDVGVLVASIAWPLFLVLALVMGILLLGLAVGWPLMWATISVEGTDSFDALSRTYAYVYQRPLQYLWYAAIAGGLGVLAGLLITVFAGAIVYLSLWCASWTAGGAAAARIARELPQGVIGVSQFAERDQLATSATYPATTSYPTNTGLTLATPPGYSAPARYSSSVTTTAPATVTYAPGPAQAVVQAPAAVATSEPANVEPATVESSAVQPAKEPVSDPVVAVAVQVAGSAPTLDDPVVVTTPSVTAPSAPAEPSSPYLRPVTTPPTITSAPATATAGVPVVGSGDQRSATFRAGVAVLSFWLAGVQVLLLGFGFSYFWTATTAIYLLLRFDVDATEMDVVHLEDEPAVFGLPPLATDAAGVAVVPAEEEEEEAAPLRTGSETSNAGSSAANQ
jgi:hypothetical protein